MYSQEKLLELVDLIYAAAGDPELWPKVLERIAAVARGTAGSIHHQDVTSQESNFSSLWNFDPQIVVPYVAYYGARNPHMTTRPNLIRTGAVNTTQMLCPDEVYLRSEYWQDYLRHYDAFPAVAATLRAEGANSSNLTIFRRPDANPFGEEERRFLLILAPHLQRAFQLHTRIQGLERKGNALSDAVDHLSHGVVLLDSKGRVMLANRAAAALFAAEKTLKPTPRGLVAAMPTESRQLNALIQGAIATGLGKDLSAGGAMAISRDGFRRPLHILVTPLRTKAIHLGKDVPVAAIFITDPESKAISDAVVFAQLYRLTRAEARLAELLAGGASLGDAADKLGVAQSTVRSQLKSIFAKTTTNRQSELVRLMSLIPARRGDAGSVGENSLRGSS